MNYYERHIGDYLKDTAHLSLLEHGVYTRLLDVYYTRECGIDSADVARLVGARSKEERTALATVLGEFFVLKGTIHIQARCDREIERFQKKAAHNREVGKLGGRPRKAQTQSEPTNNPGGFKTEPTNNPPQYPVSSNQSPVTSVREAPYGAHTLPDEYREALKSRPELDPSEVYRKFCGHYPEKKRTRTVWETWVKNERATDGAAASDPDSQQSIEALGMSLGLGKWDQAKEQFSIYRARVRAGKVVA